MHRSRPLPNTFTATLNTLWMCAYPDCKPESRVRGLVYPDLGLQTQSPVKITTSNLHLPFSRSTTDTSIPPGHPPRTYMALTNHNHVARAFPLHKDHRLWWPNSALKSPRGFPESPKGLWIRAFAGTRPECNNEPCNPAIIVRSNNRRFSATGFGSTQSLKRLNVHRGDGVRLA